MPWGSPGAGYWLPPSPRHWTPPSQPGLGQWISHDVVGTSSKRASKAVGNTNKRVGSGMTCIFSNYRLRIEILVNFMEL
jgi:hypothetical protein